MDRYCESCVNLRSVVYCKADAAYLCLSCDTKVHSANPLSKRHHRTLICDRCRRRPTYVRCYDHQKFMCRGCDSNQHDASSQHVRRVLSGYVGCPSARDLGALWGFDLSRLGVGSRVLSREFGSISHVSPNTSVVISETKSHTKETFGGMQSFILQQLVDLLRVQTTKVDRIIRREEQKMDQNDVDQSPQQFWLSEGRPDHQDMIPDTCSSPFTRLDHLESEPDETDVEGDLFLQSKSRVPTSQLWCQNMQDLGVCEEPSCSDDLDIPDIDLTFRNFEELFWIDQDPTRMNQKQELDCLVTNSGSSTKKARYASQISGTSCIESCNTSSYGSLQDHEFVLMEGKKDIKLKDRKQGQCGYRKARSDRRKRTKSQSWKFESHG